MTMHKKIIDLIFVLALLATLVMVKAKTVMKLPAGSEHVITSSETDFTCDDKPYGYYADASFDCKVFHICWRLSHNEKLDDKAKIAADYNYKDQVFMWSFFCPNTTHFDQGTLTCKHIQEDVRCNKAADIAKKVNAKFAHGNNFKAKKINKI